ncbi:MAG TPA: hypothetical protein DCS93_33755 [Microscillaceae bacterium]|nr:hypothetical protein [Microscillaceae bacterium]
MKTIKLLIIAIVISLNAVFAQENAESTSSFPILKGPYLGQTPPGLTPKLFASGLVSIEGRYEFGISFSPELDEIYFSAKEVDQKTAIYYSKLKDNKWTPIKRANFTKGEKDTEMKPFVSLSENKIYFTAYNAASRNTKLWYVTRNKDSWSNAKKLESPVNGDRVFYLNQGKSGDFYYTNIAKRKMFYTTNFSEVKALNIEFGTQGFISPSQDYLVVNARKKKGNPRRDNDIYVCFKEKDGTWSKPIDLGKEVNSNFSEAVPSITPDGKYLFFSRYNEKKRISNFYWVSTEVIHKLKKAYFNK